MARKLQPVTQLKGRRGRPPMLLTTAIRGSSERDLLVVLRRKIATAIDDESVRPTAFAALIKQFRDIDGEIRAIDARAVSAAEAADDGDDDGPPDGWDERSL